MPCVPVKPRQKFFLDLSKGDSGKSTCGTYRMSVYEMRRPTKDIYLFLTGFEFNLSNASHSYADLIFYDVTCDVYKIHRTPASQYPCLGSVLL